MKLFERKICHYNFGTLSPGGQKSDCFHVMLTPSRKLPLASVKDAGLLDVAVSAGLCKSKGDARRLVTEGGFYVNNVRMTDAAIRIGGDMLIDGRVMVLRAGKKNYCLVKVV